MTPLPTRRKPGPAKGTPVAGGRQPAPHTVPQAVLAANWHLFPAAHRPTSQAMAGAIGCSRDVLRRKMSEAGRGFTPAQLLAGQALLDQHRPPNWAAPVLQASEYTDPA